MSFLHCHTKGCDWSQDDWWSFKIVKGGYWSLPFIKIGMKYNPISVLLSYIFTERGYWYPCRIEMDREWAHENNCRIDPHSWWLAWKAFTRMFKRFKHQKWWTYESWKKDLDKGKAVCPDCGLVDFDID